jgi:hypothetical protein
MKVRAKVTQVTMVPLDGGADPGKEYEVITEVAVGDSDPESITYYCGADEAREAGRALGLEQSGTTFPVGGT